MCPTKLLHMLYNYNSIIYEEVEYIVILSFALIRGIGTVAAGFDVATIGVCLFIATAVGVLGYYLIFKVNVVSTQPN